eukprot:310340-Prymnesium_polylepis.1
MTRAVPLWPGAPSQPLACGAQTLTQRTPRGLGPARAQTLTQRVPRGLGPAHAQRTWPGALRRGPAGAAAPGCARCCAAARAQSRTAAPPPPRPRAPPAVGGQTHACRGGRWG